MARSRFADTPFLVAAAGCMVVFVACFFSLGSIPRYLAEKQLHKTADRFLRIGDAATASIHADLDSLPSVDKLNCHSGLSDVLAIHSFENAYTRWFAVMKQDAILCASSGDLHLSADGPIQTMNPNWSMRVVHAPSSKHYLEGIETRGDLQYAAILDPLLLEFDMSGGCAECVSYQISVNRLPVLTIRNGAAWTHPILHFKVDRIVGLSPVTLELVADQRFVNQFRWQGLLYAVLISAVAALAAGYLLGAWLIRRMSIRSLIEAGVKRGEFIPYYQPIVDARDSSLLGAEALVRWCRNGEIIAPAQFIDYAEENGLVASITAVIVQRVLRDLKTMGWVGTGYYISINVVPDQITETPFCAQLLSRLREAGVPGKNIAIEITERRKLHNLDEGRRRLGYLESAGVDIKLDDAGAGFGGFSYVQELPLTTLKIDKMFVDTLRAEGDAKRPMLDAIIRLAQDSGLKIIAEGVETQLQVDYLLGMGVHAIQGYFYAGPMPLRDLQRWIEAGGIRTPASAA